MQLCEPVGTVVVFATTHEKPPATEFTVYVVAEPSAVKVIFCDPAPTFVTVGVASAPVGVTLFEPLDATDASPDGVSLKVYGFALVKPVTVQLCVLLAVGVPDTEQNGVDGVPEAT